MDQGLLKNGKQNLVAKTKMLKASEEERDGAIACMEHETYEKLILKLVRTNDRGVLTSEGIVLRIKVKAIRYFYEEMERKNISRTSECASNFVTDKFLLVLEKHGDKVKHYLAFGLFNNILGYLSGNPRYTKGENIMNFFMMLHIISPQAFNASSANLNRTMLKILRMRMKSAESKHGDLGCVINRRHSKEQYTGIIVENHKAMSSNNFSVAYSVSGTELK